MAKSISVFWLVSLGLVMAAPVAADLQDGVFMLQVARTSDLEGKVQRPVETRSRLEQILSVVGQLEEVPAVMVAAIFANWIYSLNTFPLRLGWGGFRLQGHYTHDKDDVALFKNRKGQCVLAFKGTGKNRQQWLSNAKWLATAGVQTDDDDDDDADDELLPTLTASKCGLGNDGGDDDDDEDGDDQGVHRGYWDDVKKFLTKSLGGERVNNIKMSDLKKCSELIVTGHSKGGAMAGIFAACANSDSFKDEWKTVDRLFTFGAPAIAKVAPSNDVAENEIFEGARLINYDDKGDFDWLAGAFSPMFAHPKIALKELTETGLVPFRADDEETWRHPSAGWAALPGRVLTDTYLHSMELYVVRVYNHVVRRMLLRKKQ